jgi:hypothetical protein
VGLVSSLLCLPLLPVRGVIQLGELIQQRVEQELHDPAIARRELERAEEARARGELTAGEEAEVAHRVVGRMVKPRSPGAVPAENEG